jgi:shikimate dehydrogenase
MVGLVGRGILESRTPWMHEQEGDAQGLRLLYSLFDFTHRGWADEDLPKLLDAVQMAGFAGLNITFPFKQAVMPLLDELSEGAQAIGAVNTIAFRDGKRIGHNTDVSGFAQGFLDGLPGVALDHVLQLGCGGAGSATAHALLSTIGVQHLSLFDTDTARVTALRDQLAETYGAGRISIVEDARRRQAKSMAFSMPHPSAWPNFPARPSM